MGTSCGSLALSPATSSSVLWPKKDDKVPASGWGFSVPMFDPKDNLYHAFSTVACGVFGVVGQGGGNSWITHLTSPSQSGPWTFLRMFAPQTTFGPMSAVAADGTFTLLFRVNILGNTTLCAGAGNDPLPPSTLDDTDIPLSSIVSGDPEKGTSIYVASAPSASGPWRVVRVNITGAGEIHKSNPSLALLPDGRWMMGYRYNPVGGSLNAVAIASSFEGPYVNIVNVTEGKSGDEDPFTFYSLEDGGSGEVVGHLLYHNRDFGYHAFGKLDGSPWSVSPTGSHAFNLSVAMGDGSTLTLGRRERPALVMEKGGGGVPVPVALINGVQNVGATGACYSFLQALRR